MDPVSCNLLSFSQLSAVISMKEILDSAYSLRAFLKYAWPVIEGDVPFIDGWHIGAIAEHLQACLKRQIKNLMIHVPPRSSKSSLISVAFPAWAWIQSPHERFMYASYAGNLALEHSLKCRRLIESAWYQERFGHIYKIVSDRNTMRVFENDKGGYRLATSTGGSSTGSGGSIIIGDDMNNARDGESQTKRESTNMWWSQVWSTRLNNPKEDVKIVVQQRLHTNDVSGFILENDHKNEWVKLILPNEFEKLNKCITVPLKGTDKPWEDPRKEEGELLCPERFGREETQRYKKELGEYGYAGQFQQRPSPAGGGIIRQEWFGIWKKAAPPPLLKIIQSWDTAFKEGQQNDYSVCSTWGIFSSEHLDKGNKKDPFEVYYNCAILLSLWRGRAGYPELRKRALRLFENFTDTGDRPKKFKASNRPNIILMEDKASGQSLIGDLYKSGIKNIIGINPTKYGDKIARIHYVAPLLENKRVYLVSNPPDFKDLRMTSKMLMEECSKFPKGEFDDIVDTLSQFLIYCKRTQLLRITHDPISHFEEPDAEGVQFF